MCTHVLSRTHTCAHIHTPATSIHANLSLGSPLSHRRCPFPRVSPSPPVCWVNAPSLSSMPEIWFPLLFRTQVSVLEHPVHTQQGTTAGQSWLRDRFPAGCLNARPPEHLLADRSRVNVRTQSHGPFCIRESDRSSPIRTQPGAWHVKDSSTSAYELINVYKAAQARPGLAGNDTSESLSSPIKMC